MNRSVKRSFSVMLILLLLMCLFFWRTEQNSPSASDTQSVSTQIQSEGHSAAYSKTDENAEDHSQTIVESSLIEDSLANQMKDVADLYRQQSRYPHYSIPVVDQALAKSPQDFEVAKVSTPTFDERGEVLPFTLSAATDKPEYAHGETMMIRVTVEGADNTTAIFATASLKSSQGHEPSGSRKSLAPLNQSPHVFQTEVDTGAIQITGDAQEFLAVITAQIEGREHITSVPFVLSQVSAELIGVNNVAQIDDVLALTLDYQVHQTGYYFVNAYLDDAKTNKALLSLQTEGKMEQGRGKLTLKAHHQALKDAGSQGPYHLRIIRSFRGAKLGESSDVPTAISQMRYPIPDFAFEGYADIPFSDPQVEKRIKAIESLASE